MVVVADVPDAVERIAAVRARSVHGRWARRTQYAAVPGVVGHEEATEKDSFEEGIFDCPHYTRPEIFRGRVVPDVLMTGHHQKIEEWRKQEAVRKTEKVRPDL